MQCLCDRSEQGAGERTLYVVAQHQKVRTAGGVEQDAVARAGGQARRRGIRDAGVARE